MLLLSAMMLAGCSINDYGTCPPDGEDETLKVRIDLAVPNAATRALDHDSETGTALENYINVADGDFRVLIFDKDGELFKEIGSDECEIVPVAGKRNIIYSLSTELVVPKVVATARMSQFKMMVLANWQSMQRHVDADYQYPSFEGYTINDDDRSLYKEAGNLTRSGFNFEFSTGGEEYLWTPSYEKKWFIPMFGVSDKPIDMKEAVKMSQYDDTEPMTEIFMLRSLAKIELAYDTLSGEGITSAGWSHSFWGGRFIPDLIENSEWNQKTQVVSPSLPNPVPNIGALIPGAAMYKLTQDEENKVWYMYIPETYLPLNGTSTSLEDSVWPRPIIGFTYNGQSYSFELDNNIDVTQGKGDGTLDRILRNHIYRYTITETSASVDLTLNVLPWDMEWEDDPWYFDEPAFADGGYLAWIDQITDGYACNQSSLRVRMKTGTSACLEGSFTLTDPKGANIILSLSSLGGKSDAFEFVDVKLDDDGNPELDENENVQITERFGQKITGVIDGNAYRFYIVNRYETVSDFPNEARLDLMVEYPDKTVREVYLVDPMKWPGDDADDKIKHYTLVQEKTEIM